MATWDELTALRPGAALRHRGEEFVIERCIRFEERGSVWYEHRLSSDRSGRSLWLEIPPGPGGPEIEHGGETLALLVSGRAAYRTLERSAAAKTGELVYHEYALGDRRVT